MAMNKRKWNCIADLALLVMITNVGGVCRSVLHEQGALVDAFRQPNVIFSK